jgi:hypothetical protein
LLISWKHNFIFLHIPKTAGTSLTQALAPYARKEDRLLYAARSTPLVRRAMTVFLGGDEFITRVTGFGAHTRLGAVEKALGRETVEPMRKVCFVRNPYSRAYSLYSHICRHKTHPRHEQIAPHSFQSALDVMMDEKWETQSGFLRYLKDEKISADFVGRFERMDEDVDALFDMLGLPPRKKLRKINIGGGPAPDYQALFESRHEKFLDVYKDDFENFGYSTDPAKATEPPLAPPATGDWAAQPNDGGK